MKEFLRKELYVVKHTQTARFRIVKYIVLFAIFGAIYWWKGGRAMLVTLGIALAAAIAMHFFFRSKTKGWEEPWGPFKPLW